MDRWNPAGAGAQLMCRLGLESTTVQHAQKIESRPRQNLKSATYNGRGKAHLVKKGLMSAGRAPITATEQQDQDSVRKGRGNRISSKAPAASVAADRS